MNLEELIYERLAGDEELARKLAKYNGLPAIFSPEAPDDGQDGWKDQMQYPQIVYNVDFQANEERKSAGTLSVNLLYQNTAAVAPKQIEAQIKECLGDVLLKPSDGALYAFAWARTDALSLPEGSGLILGSKIRFDILEYGSQETTDPDPVPAINRYLKEMYPEALVIGLDSFDSVTETLPGCPIFYCRPETLKLDRETNAVVWMACKLAIHLLCPDSVVRKKMVTAVANGLGISGEVTLMDGSPMFIKQLKVDHKADYLSAGQLYVTGHYGVLRYRAEPHRIAGVAVQAREGAKTRKEEKGMVTAKKTAGASYTVQELVENAGLFGVRRECMAAALRLAGKKDATQEEARKLVCDYMEQEVG